MHAIYHIYHYFSITPYACAAVIDHVTDTSCLYRASCYSSWEAWPLDEGLKNSMPAMEGDARSLRVKIISMGAAECGKVSLCILCVHV